MSPELRKLFSQHVGSAFVKQLNLADLLGDRSWGVDLGKGTATFGDDLEFPLQLLGSEADGDQSWLWAWANTGSNFPPEVLKSCEKLRALGENLEVAELTESSFKTEVADGHTLSLVASGMHSDSCYYRGPYGSGANSGALFFLLSGLPPEVTEPARLERVLTTITQVMSTFDVDHLPMTREFLTLQKFELTESDQQLSAKRTDGIIQIEFDSKDRIVNTTSTINPR